MTSCPTPQISHLGSETPVSKEAVMTAISNHLPIPALTEQDIDRWESQPRRFTQDGCEEMLSWDRNGNGYAGFQVKIDGTWRHVLAHRVAYRLAFGIDPGQATVEHLCANRRCVAPEHLVLMSMRANVLAPSSNCAGAVNARKTRCIRGHEFTGPNTRIHRDAQGRLSRQCLTCERARHRAQSRARAQAEGRTYRSKEQIIEDARLKREEIAAMAQAKNPDVCKRGHDLTDPKVVRIDRRKDGRTTRACRPCANQRLREKAAMVATPTVTT